jgi:hypothetical protein
MTAIAQRNDAFLTDHANRIRKLGKRVVSDAIEIGKLLSECKDRLEHGEWLPWLKREFSWSDRHARNFMKLHQLSTRSENFSNLNLPLSSLFLLAAPSTPEAAREEVVARAEAGEQLQHQDVQEIVDEARGQSEPSSRVHQQRGTLRRQPDGIFAPTDQVTGDDADHADFTGDNADHVDNEHRQEDDEAAAEDADPRFVFQDRANQACDLAQYDEAWPLDPQRLEQAREQCGRVAQAWTDLAETLRNRIDAGRAAADGDWDAAGLQPTTPGEERSAASGEEQAPAPRPRRRRPRPRRE